MEVTVWKSLNCIFDILKYIFRQPLLSIRIMEDRYENNLSNLRFEIENRSNIKTSLKPLIRSTFWYLKSLNLVKGSAGYYIREQDRYLPPFQPKILSAVASKLPNSYNFSWFRTYSFYPTRGLKTTVYVRNSLLEPLRRLSFTFEWLRFRIMGKLKKDTCMSIDDYHNLKRTQGPY